ncbi:MAG: peptidase M28 family protein, partial [Rhodanobacteraceae bacterium]
MPRSLPFLITALLCASSAAAADKPTEISDAALTTASQLRERALSDNVAWDFTEGLTTEVGQRLAGSENDAKAREWVIAKFKALGFDKVWTEPVTYPKWVRRSQHAEITAPYPQPLELLALGGSPATPAGGITAEVVAFESNDALKAASPDVVRGKIVYIG